MKTNTALLLTCLLCITGITAIVTWRSLVQNQVNSDDSQTGTQLASFLTPLEPSVYSPPASILTPIPAQHVIPLQHHTFQTFNNCGPASLAMQLSYHGVTVSQQEIGRALRPFQHPTGDNDDKSVTLSELAHEAEKYDLKAVFRPNGSPEIMEQLVANDLPVVVRTWLKPNEDIGHYRVIRGYDSEKQVFIQDDSLQGKNLDYAYKSLNEIWQPFNYEYLVIFPADKTETVKQILGEHYDTQTAWHLAEQRILAELEHNPEDVFSRFNLSVTQTHLGKYQEAVKNFEKVEQLLPPRMLWYQIEPLEAYYQLGDYDRVFALTDKILNNNNRAFSELYLIRGNIYENQGNTEAARSEYEKAAYYNKNLKAAQQALEAL